MMVLKTHTVQIEENMLYPSSGSLFFSHCFTKLSSGSSNDLLIKTVRTYNKRVESLFLFLFIESNKNL